MAVDEYSVIETGIPGALLQPLEIVPTPAGAVLHMLRPDFPLMPQFAAEFGEIYFSEIFAGEVKAWKLHREQAQHFAVPMGLIRLVLYDGREDSPGFGKLVEIKLGRPDNYSLLRIPCGIWYGFQCLSPHTALICNCADRPHNPQESQKMPPDCAAIPWNWI